MLSMAASFALVFLGTASRSFGKIAHKPDKSRGTEHREHTQSKFCELNTKEDRNEAD